MYVVVCETNILTKFVCPPGGGTPHPKNATPTWNL